MNKVRILAIVLTFVTASVARGADMPNIAWNRANLPILRSFPKDSIQRFVNALRGDDPLQAEIGGFAWYDVATDGSYNVVATEDLSGRSFFDYLAIYTQSGVGKVTLRQWIPANDIGTNLEKVVRDLNKDGRDELILPKLLISYSHA